MTHTDILGGLPGEQWIPSNSTIGAAFIETWCGTCARDKAMRDGAPVDECDDNEVCEIIGASFRREAVEWRRMPDGDIKCIAFVEVGQTIPPPKCPHTGDLFGDTE